MHCGGGLHHAKISKGEGFCPLNDIALSIYMLRLIYPKLRVLYVDTDIHQGNGLDDIFKSDPNVLIFDMYNADIYPGTLPTRKNQKYDFPFHGIVAPIIDEAYLPILAAKIPQALAEFQPQLVIINAGSDPYIRDYPMGGARISFDGMLEKDEIVAKHAHEQGIPFVMYSSGGYCTHTAHIYGSSCENIIRNILRLLPPKPRGQIIADTLEAARLRKGSPPQ